MNKLYWMDARGHIAEALVNMNREEFFDAVQEIRERSTTQTRE